jgi:sortase A
MASRILGSVGRFFITSGIVVLLFVGYQLWGTGLQEAAAQGSLDSEFDELLGDLEDPGTAAAPATTTTTTVAPSTSAVSATSTTTVPPSTTTTTSNTIPVFEDDLAEALYRDGGEAIARIIAPSIDIRKVVVEGVKVEDLRNGPGHYRATVLPGQAGNSGIAGHRTTYGAPFNRIDELVPGDEINVRTVQGFFTYRVIPAGEAFAADRLPPNVDFRVPEGDEDLGHIIVGPEATWVLGDFGDNRLTLTACHPKYSARQRIIVAAVLVGEPVDAPPPPAEYLHADDTLATENTVAVEEATGIDADGNIVDTSLSGEDIPAGSEQEPTSAEDGRAAFVDEVSLDEGLNGDADALVPALLWGAAAIAVYLAFKELARRWKLWPSIALGILPVVVLMGLSFEKIDRYLPAG